LHPDSEKDFPALPLFCGVALGAGLTPLIQNSGEAAALLLAMLCLASLAPCLRRLRIPAILFGCVIATCSSHLDSIRAQRLLDQMRSLDLEKFVIVEGSLVDRVRCDSVRCSARLARVTIGQKGIRFQIDALNLDVPVNVQLDGDVVRAEGMIRAGNGTPRVAIKSALLISSRAADDEWHPRFWRKRIAARIASTGGDARGGQLVEALALGDKDSISNDRKEKYRDAGVYHLLVFSGMQITIAAMLLLAVVRNRRLPRIADWMLVALSLIAPAIAGGAPSVVRASMMIGLDAFSRILHRPTSYTNLLFLSAAIRLVFEPSDIIDPSFLLTYCATSGLLLIAGSLHRRTVSERVVAVAAAMIAAELLLSTITRFFFLQWTVGSSIVTLVLSPVFTLLLILSFAAIVSSLALPTLVPPLLLLIAELEELVLSLCSWLTTKFQFMHVDAPPAALLVVCALAAFLLLLAVLPKRVRFIAGLPLLFAHFDLSSEPGVSFFVRALDVGQGDAILLRSPSAVVLVDSGPPPNGIGLPIALKRLVSSRIRELDAVVLTHAHPDHCGGAAAIVRYLRVGHLVVPRLHLSEPCVLAAALEAARRGTRLTAVGRDESFRVGSVEVNAPRFRFKASRLNNESLITRATIGRERIFLAGDIEKDAERFWINELPRSSLRSSIVKLPHHGSLTSSTQGFLESLEPQLALITVGRRNPFGHPHPQVIDRLRLLGVKIERTDISGEITLELSPRSRRVTRQFDYPF